MRILVDVTHPAHVHFFRHAIGLWRARGHEVFITARRKDIALALLDHYGLEHDDLGAARSGLAGLAIELATRNARLWTRMRSIRPQVVTAIGGVFAAQVGWARGVPSVIFTDTENATLSNRLTFPFATVVSTPRCYGAPVPAAKHRPYAGYHELAYTHPTYFTPDPGALAEFGLGPEEPFIVLRLVSWGAAHDVRDHGFTEVEDAVRQLERFGRVLISSEAPLPPALAERAIRAAPHLVHHLLAYARLFIGESATMASESATLGTPAILVSTSRRGYTDEQESRYGLTFTFSDPAGAQRAALAKALEILRDPPADSRWAARRERLLAETIDVTEHIVHLVEAHGDHGAG